MDRLKLAISHPLQVVNTMLSLQSFQNHPSNRPQATEEDGSTTSLQDRYTEHLSKALQAQLDRLQNAQEKRFEELAEAVKQLSASTAGTSLYSSESHPQANPNIQTLPDSAYGSDLPSVFSVEETSVYTADADFDALSNQTEPAVVPAASIDSRLAAPHLSIYGYRHLNALGRALWNGRSFSSQAASSSRPHHLRA